MPCLQILFCITYAIFHTHGTCAPIHFQIYGLSLKPPKAPSTLSQKNVCIPYIQYYVWTYRSGEKEKRPSPFTTDIREKCTLVKQKQQNQTGFCKQKITADLEYSSCNEKCIAQIEYSRPWSFSNFIANFFSSLHTAFLRRMSVIDINFVNDGQLSIFLITSHSRYL